MPVCAGECKEDLTGGRITWLSRSAKDEKGQVRVIHGRRATERLPFCTKDAAKVIGPDITRADNYVIRLTNTWRLAAELAGRDLSDLVTYDQESKKRGGQLFGIWITQIRGDVMLALSLARWLKAELEYRISAILFERIYTEFYPGATEIRQIVVRHQLGQLPELWESARNSRAEVEAAREAKIEIPSGPRRDLQRAAERLYRLQRAITDELGNAFLGKKKESLTPLGREVLRAVKGSAFAVELDLEVEDAAGTEPEEVRVTEPAVETEDAPVPKGAAEAESPVEVTPEDDKPKTRRKAAKPKAKGKRKARAKKTKKPEGKVTTGAPNGAGKRKKQRRRRAAAPLEEGDD